MGYSFHIHGDSTPYQGHIPNATDSRDGAMSKEDKAKLNDGLFVSSNGHEVLTRDADGRVISDILWTDTAMTSKKFETNISRNGSGEVSVITEKRYSGGLLVQTSTGSVVRDLAEQIQSIDWTIT